MSRRWESHVALSAMISCLLAMAALSAVDLPDWICFSSSSVEFSLSCSAWLAATCFCVLFLSLAIAAVSVSICYSCCSLVAIWLVACVCSSFSMAAISYCCSSTSILLIFASLAYLTTSQSTFPLLPPDFATAWPLPSADQSLAWPPASPFSLR